MIEIAGVQPSGGQPNQSHRPNGGDIPAVPHAVVNEAAPTEQHPIEVSNAAQAVPLERHLSSLPVQAQQSVTPAPEPESGASAESDEKGQEKTEDGGVALHLSPATSPTTPHQQPVRPAKNEASPAPRRYQPAQRAGTATRHPSVATSEAGNAGEQADASNARPARIELRFRNQRGGTVVISLLPSRRDGMPALIEVAGAGSSPLTLNALRDDWYQDVVLPELGMILRTGAEWYADTKKGRLRWSLAGRDLYVLGNNDEWSGPVSRPRLVLGDEHAVLCTEELASQVEELLQQCCTNVPVRLTHDDGLPAGWVAYRAVVPIKPLPLDHTPNILDALRPSPDIEIALRGGIRLQYKQWLAGYPPAIRLYGEGEHAGTLTIDGIDAERQPDGSFTVAGWDTVGDHVVSCGGQISSYSIIEASGWDAWTAYSFPSLITRDSEPGICGALVFSSAPDRTPLPPVLVPASNPILLGGMPGQIYRCTIQEDIRLPYCAAFPGFVPIWAVPADPLRADKRIARVLYLPALGASGSIRSISKDKPANRKIRQWCAAILDCARKGIALEPTDQQTGDAWRSYRNTARRVWRASRESQ
jgi:hypothetical protein